MILELIVFMLLFLVVLIIILFGVFWVYFSIKQKSIVKNYKMEQEIKKGNLIKVKRPFWQLFIPFLPKYKYTIKKEVNKDKDESKIKQEIENSCPQPGQGRSETYSENSGIGETDTGSSSPGTSTDVPRQQSVSVLPDSKPARDKKRTRKAKSINRRKKQIDRIRRFG